MINDKISTINDLKEIAKKFVDERDWAQFHTLKNLSMYINLEASELMEIFVWSKDNEIELIASKKRKEIEHEIADIFMVLLSFCNKANIDLSIALQEKLEIQAKKYPIDKVKGKAAKYTEYKD